MAVHVHVHACGHARGSEGMRGGRTDWSKSKNESWKPLSVTGSPGAPNFNSPAVSPLRKQNWSSTYVSLRPCALVGPRRLISARPPSVSRFMLALLAAYGLSFRTSMSNGTPAFVVPTFL